MAAPATTGTIKVPKDSALLTDVAAIKAVAPAGGWVRRRNCMAAIDSATDAAIHTYDSELGMMLPK